jgi:hypothetical protein
MMRKRKALSSVNGNILSRPPVRRQLDSYVSMESLEDRSHADSKTPKISNLGGSSVDEPIKRRTTHRRPPLPTRPKYGGLGSSILDPARRTPRLTRSGISFRWSPTRSSPDHVAPGINQLSLKVQRAPMIPLQAKIEQSQVADLAEPSFEKHSIESQAVDAQRPGTSQLQGRQGIPTNDNTSRDNSTLKCASQGVTHVAVRKLEYYSATAFRSDGEDQKEREDVKHVVNETSGIVSDKKESDDDMICDSSDEVSLLNSSDSSPEEQRGSMSPSEIRPTSQMTLNNHRQSPVQYHTATLPCGADEEFKSKDDELGIGRVSGRMRQERTATKLDKRETHIVGSTVGAESFEQENLAEDTDLTDMASLSSDNGQTSDAFSDDKYDDDKNHNKNMRERVTSRLEDRNSDNSDRSSEFDAGDMEDNDDEQRTARRLTYNDFSQASLEEFHRTARARDPIEEESIEAWSIGRCRNSPILIKIDGKEYIHPPLPAGWRIKISKTHKRPIYIHPDIGRTFHCPVNLPRNVFYVRRKDGTLEKRAKVDPVIATDSPRARRAPDTPPSVTQRTPESCSRSPSSCNPGVASSTSASDSTSQLIRGALKFSALCVKNSSQNLLRAEMLIGDSKNTPSTLSDVVRLYEAERSREGGGVEFKNRRDIDGYDCDISDSGRSRDSSSSLSNIQKNDNGGSIYNNGLQPCNTGALSPVTPMTTEVPQSQELVGRFLSESEVEIQVPKMSGSNQRKKRLGASCIDETLETCLTLGTPNENGNDTENYHDPTNNSQTLLRQNKDSSVPASAQKLVQGEYIDGWFTPNAIIDQETGEYEEVATLRHSAKRNKSSDCTSKSNPKSFKRGWMLSTEKKSSFAVNRKNHAGIFETVEPKAPPSSDSKRTHSHASGKVNTAPRSPINIDQPSEKYKEQTKSSQKITSSNSLLPFFDIFEQHLTVNASKASPVSKAEEDDKGMTPRIRDMGIDLKDHLPDWKSPNCSEIEGSSPTEKDFSCSPALVETASSPFMTHAQKSESRVSAQAIVDASNATSCRVMDKIIEYVDSLSKPASNARSGRQYTPANAQEEADNDVSSPATGLPFNENQNIEKQAVPPSSKSDDDYLKHDHSIDDAPSDAEFQATDYQSPEISTEGCPVPESECSSNEESHDVSDPSPSIDLFRRESPISQNEPHNDEDKSLEGDIALKNNEDEMNWIGSGDDGASSPNTVSIKRHQMSWRVLNPTYPRCSLQRLEEIALQQTNKKKTRISSIAVKKKRNATKKGVNKEEKAKRRK